MTVTIEDAAPRLAELIASVQSGEEVILTRDNLPVARLTPPDLIADEAPRFREPGSALGKATLYMSDDFDAPLDDFEDYR